jgi:hypothetical protein
MYLVAVGGAHEIRSLIHPKFETFQLFPNCETFQLLKTERLNIHQSFTRFFPHKNQKPNVSAKALGCP